MNAEITTNGTVYANGPVIVQGMDIKAELVRLRSDITHLDEKCAARADEVFYFVLEKFQLKEKDKGAIQLILDHLKSLTDAASRLQFIASALTQLDPVTAIAVAVLLRHVKDLKLVITRE